MPQILKCQHKTSSLEGKNQASRSCCKVSKPQEATPWLRPAQAGGRLW